VGVQLSVNTVTFLLFQHENEKSQLAEIIKLKEMEKINPDKSLTAKNEEKWLQAITGEKENEQKQQELEVHVVSMQYTKALFYTHFCYAFSFNVLYQFTPLFNLDSLIFALMPFGQFIFIYLSLFNGNSIFDLCPLFREHN
jgi:hypothetical protein